MFDAIYESLTFFYVFVIYIYTTLPAGVLLSSHQSYTEIKYNADLAKFLKYQPERIGGGGRGKND